ncbi:uncharacterized protein LOC132728675 [Ruditapes philippinarum]|uniref:uncharacterized protein LOC132728675 n=1 Tax=Ruditapes philippinarum TaxID=129788 RepID=UPI00295B0735|nr:uncharacterized protein LOC132728675 [Ruditapes philippinarum]XP_060570347.1 uncharacterized protein LOC132728675 [Ruditapes philippinarum]
MERLMKLAYESDTKPYRIKREEQVQYITESEAEDICGNIINGSMLVTDLSDALVGEDPNAVIDQCMFDVMTGNDESLAGVHADAINTAAKMKFSRDPVFVTNHTETV